MEGIEVSLLINNNSIKTIVTLTIILTATTTLAPILSYASNEGSYKYGFNSAVSDYETCYQGWMGTEV
jgi:hypothetical protein